MTKVSSSISTQIASLSDTIRNDLVKIDHIDDSCGMNLIRLSEMGFTINTPVRIVKNNGHGPMVIEARGVQAIIGRGLSNKIKIRRIS